MIIGLQNHFGLLFPWPIKTGNRGFTVLLICQIQYFELDFIWASIRQNLSSGFLTKQDENQSPQLQRLARKIKIDILFVSFVALRPKSTAMVIAGRSVHLTTLFPGQA